MHLHCTKYEYVKCSFTFTLYIKHCTAFKLHMGLFVQKQCIYIYEHCTMYNVHGMQCLMYNSYHAHIHRLYIYIRVHILNVQIHILIDPFPLGTEF